MSINLSPRKDNAFIICMQIYGIGCTYKKNQVGLKEDNTAQKFLNLYRIDRNKYNKIVKEDVRWQSINIICKDIFDYNLFSSSFSYIFDMINHHKFYLNGLDVQFIPTNTFFYSNLIHRSDHLRKHFKSLKTNSLTLHIIPHGINDLMIYTTPIINKLNETGITRDMLDLSRNRSKNNNTNNNDFIILKNEGSNLELALVALLEFCLTPIKVADNLYQVYELSSRNSRKK